MSRGYKRTKRWTAEEGVERPDLAGVTGGRIIGRCVVGDLDELYFVG